MNKNILLPFKYLASVLLLFSTLFLSCVREEVSTPSPEGLFPLSQAKAYFSTHIGAIYTPFFQSYGFDEVDYSFSISSKSSVRSLDKELKPMWDKAIEVVLEHSFVQQIPLQSSTAVEGFLLATKQWMSVLHTVNSESYLVIEKFHRNDSIRHFVSTTIGSYAGSKDNNPYLYTGNRQDKSFEGFLIITDEAGENICVYYYKDGIMKQTSIVAGYKRKTEEVSYGFGFMERTVYTKSGNKCSVCGSNYISNYIFMGPNDTMYLICSNCGHWDSIEIPASYCTWIAVDPFGGNGWFPPGYNISDFFPPEPSQGGSGGPPTLYSLNVSANPVSGGSVSGGGSYMGGSNVYIMATAYSGYKFEKWTGSSIVYDSFYPFSIYGNLSFTANFRPCFNGAGTKANPLPSMALAPPAGSQPIAATYGKTRKNGTKDHWGIDLAGAVGTPVYAQFGGTIGAVVSEQPNRIDGEYPLGYSGDTDNGGNRIYINSNINGNIVSHQYQHLQAVTPIATNPSTGQHWKTGDIINAGEVIGYIGITGNADASAPHLHLIASTGNPVIYLNATISTTTTVITTPCD